MNVTEVLNIVALIVVPLLAVIVGQYLQNRSDRRKDKMRVFKTLMTDRIYGWTRESVDSLNIIDVVFADDKKVREAWSSLFDRLNVSYLDAQQLGKINQAKYKLLEEMAKALGYGCKITWETIQNPYMPVGLANQLQSQEEYNAGMLSVIGHIDSILSSASGQANETAE